MVQMLLLTYRLLPPGNSATLLLQTRRHNYFKQIETNFFIIDVCIS